jgi:hypothetical protein
MCRCGACNRGAVTAVTGHQGAPPRALQCAVCAAPGGAAAGWLRARAVPGTGTGRHRLTGRGLGAASQPVFPRPAFGGWSFDRFFFPKRGQESNLRQVSFKTALPLSYQWWPAGSRTRHFLSGRFPQPGRYQTFAPCGIQVINGTQRVPDLLNRQGGPWSQPWPVSVRRWRLVRYLSPDACQPKV